METKTKTVNPFANAIRPKVREFAKKAGGLFQYAAAIESTIRRVMIENAAQCGKSYEPFTTFANDFAIAECLGDNAILDTYKRAVRGWIGNYKYMTELVMVLNHLCWFWFYNKEQDLSKLYSELYYKSKDAFYEFYETKDDDSDDAREKKAEACRYFFDCTD